MRACKDLSDREGTITQAAICPPGGLIHHLLTSRSFFSFQGKLSLSITERVNRLVPAPQPNCNIHLDAYQPSNSRPTNLPGRPVTAAPPATNVQPPQGACSVRAFSATHQAGCLRELYPTPVTQFLPWERLGQGSAVSTGTPGAAWQRSVFISPDTCVCPSVCQHPSTPYRLQLTPSADPLPHVHPRRAYTGPLS